MDVTNTLGGMNTMLIEASDNRLGKIVWKDFLDRKNFKSKFIDEEYS